MPTGESEAVAFALNEQDFVAASNFVFRRNLDRWHFGLVRLIALGCFAVYVVLALVESWSTGEPFASYDDSFIIVAFLGILLLPYIPGFLARRQFRSADFAKLRAPMRMEISAAGLRSIGGVADSLTPWPSILDIAVTADAAYLFIFRNNVHLVPRHAFADEAAFNRFVAAAHSYWRPGVSADTA